jgi:AcrR family transcriptional regulator
MYNENVTDETTRRYRKRKRARQEEETRRRITEAVVELHRTVGPANTKVTEVAERAGVSRMTVYNHFPTEGDLIAACSAHWAARNPFPDPADWAGLEDPAERLRRALGELYVWYERTQDMMGNVLRDASLVEPLDDVLDATWRPYLDGLIETLVMDRDDASSGRGVRAEDASEEAELRAAVRVAAHFQTWRLLTDSGLGSGVAARVAARMVVGLAASPAAD